MAEVVEDGVSGLHFEPGNPEDLAAKVQVLIDDPERCRAMGRAARDQFLAAYGPEQNIAHLERIYRDAAQAL
jgi:glycosyltransferase involved in cell wall biosynthesis